MRELVLHDPRAEYLTPPLQGHRLADDAYISGARLLAPAERAALAEARAAAAEERAAAEAEVRRLIEARIAALEARIAELEARLRGTPPDMTPIYRCDAPVCDAPHSMVTRCGVVIALQFHSTTISLANAR